MSKLSLQFFKRLSGNDEGQPTSVESALPAVSAAPNEEPTPTEFIEPSAVLAVESVLVGRARSDPSAFGELYQRYVERIYAYIYHRVGNEQDTEDLTARTFYRALDKFDTYEDRGLPFGAWLFRIAHNLVANWHRDRSRRSFISLDRIWSQRHEEDDPEEVAQKNEQTNALWAAINRLPKDRRDLLLYKFSSQLSNIEIGELMNKSESAIKSLYFRTLASLRSDLESKGWGASGLPTVVPEHGEVPE
ncbi:MAG: sigma-70 family RNA polymerase sigma factor [Caldilineaceae bacterium]